MFLMNCQERFPGSKLSKAWFDRPLKNLSGYAGLPWKAWNHVRIIVKPDGKQASVTDTFCYRSFLRYRKLHQFPVMENTPDKPIIDRAGDMVL